MQQSLLMNGVFIVLAMLAGAATAYQPGINAKFAEYAGAKPWGGFNNFLTGLLAMTVVLLIFRPAVPAVSKLGQGPWWMWLGGLCGAFFVTLALILVPKMGASVYLSTMIAGQLVASVIIDHFGHVGLAERHITPGRIAGVLLIVGGMTLIRKF
jgi:bacterial/archaeal transporter family-2 protein